MFRPFDDFRLHRFGQPYEIIAVAADADHKVFVLFRMLSRFFENFPACHVDLHFKSAAHEVRADERRHHVDLTVVKDGFRELHVHRDAADEAVVIPAGRREDRCRRAFVFASLGGAGTVAERESRETSVRSCARLLSEVVVHDPAEQARDQTTVPEGNAEVFTRVRDEFGKLLHVNVRCVVVPAVVAVLRQGADLCEKFRGALIVVRHCRFQFGERQLMFFENQLVDGVQRVRGIRHADERRHDPVVARTALLNVRAGLDAVTDKAGEKRIEAVFCAFVPVQHLAAAVFADPFPDVCEVLFHKFLHAAAFVGEHRQHFAGQIHVRAGNPYVR